MTEEIYFKILTPLGFKVRTTLTYWNVIINIKHPVMTGRENEVKEVLRIPNQIRRSRNDSDVYMFYKYQDSKRWICAVVKKLNGEGFLITTYPTDSIKEGEIIWSE